MPFVTYPPNSAPASTMPWPTATGTARVGSDFFVLCRAGKTHATLLGAATSLKVPRHTPSTKLMMLHATSMIFMKPQIHMDCEGCKGPDTQIRADH